MSQLYFLRTVLVATLISALTNFVTPPTAAIETQKSKLPSDSLYRLSIPLTDAQNRHFNLQDLPGHPVIITMFYGDCATACPILLENLQQTMAALKPEAGKLSVLLVSLNPANDTASTLASLSEIHNLDPHIFRLAVSTNDSHTRALAAALHIKYRKLSSGEISHSTNICLVDVTGKIIASSTQLSTAPDSDFLMKIRSALK